MGWARKKLRQFDKSVIRPVLNTVEAIIEDPKKLAMVALSVLAPGAGTALGSALGLSGTAATLVGQAAINTALNGGDIKAGIMAAAIPVVGKEIAGTAASAFVDSGMDKALAESAGKVVAGAGIATVQGKDPLSALISGGLSEGTAAITRDIPGFADLPEAAKKSINAAVATELAGGDGTQSAINAAMNVGVNSLAQYTNSLTADTSGPSSSDFIEGYFKPGGEGYIAPEPTPEPTPTPEPEPAPVETDIVKQLEDAGLASKEAELPVDQPPEPLPIPSPDEDFIPTPLPEELRNPITVEQNPNVDDFINSIDQYKQPEETDWNALYNTGLSEEEIAKREALMKSLPGQEMQIDPENWDSFDKNLSDIMTNKGGYTSQWQTVGNDRVMINDDGTGIGTNENGDSYALSQEEVDSMVKNGVLNTAASGYVAATGGTGNTPGGSGKAPTAPAKPAAPAKPTAAAPAKPTAPTKPGAPTPTGTAPTTTVPNAPQQTSNADLLNLLSSKPELANIKSFKELFGEDLFGGSYVPPSAGGAQTDAEYQAGSSTASQGDGEEQFFGGGHVDDFDVDALLQILRS